MIEHLLALAVPIIGVGSAILFQLPGEGRRKKPRDPNSVESTKGDTSAKSQGDDHRRTGEQE